MGTRALVNVRYRRRADLASGLSCGPYVIVRDRSLGKAEARGGPR
jgi:hypothetical protein